MQSERNQRIVECDMKIRNLHRYKLHLYNFRAEGFINDIEYQEFYDFYDRETTRLDIESSALWNESRYIDTPVENTPEWVQNFLQFSHMKELDRFAVVRMVRSIRLFATKEIIINFAYQAEFEQLLHFSTSGGYAYGAKEP